MTVNKGLVKLVSDVTDIRVQSGRVEMSPCSQCAVDAWHSSR